MKINANVGGASNFELIFPKIPSESTIEQSRTLTLNIYQSVIPSITLGTETVNWQSSHYDIDNGEITFENWFTFYVVSSDLSNWKSLYNWLMLINNNEDHSGGGRRAPGVKKYATEGILKITDNFRNPILKVSFAHMWPTILGEVSLSYRDDETILNGTVNFTYSRYRVEEI